MLASATATVLLLALPAVAAGPRYWIDESTDFTGNGCENADLNNVTSSLKSRLDADGWGGTRWSNANAWPEDFIEQNLGGIDHVAGDDETLSVYAGHGWRALIQFGFQRGGRCTVSFPPPPGSGTQGGDDAAYAMWVTSVTVHLDFVVDALRPGDPPDLRYQPPSVKDDQPRISRADRRPAQRARVDRGDGGPTGWFTGDNSPIALTFGVGSTHCGWVRNTARLRGQVRSPTRPHPTPGTAT
jgi:hypothetical protein